MTGSAPAKRLFIKTYGCQMNVYDSERMADVLAPLGYGMTDSPEDARRLADWAGDRRDAVNVNLIRFNPHEGCAYADPEDPAVEAFAHRLKAEGCFVTVRRSRGRDAEGACGQLARRTPP